MYNIFLYLFFYFNFFFNLHFERLFYFLIKNLKKNIFCYLNCKYKWSSCCLLLLLVFKMLSLILLLLMTLLQQLWMYLFHVAYKFICLFIYNFSYKLYLLKLVTHVCERMENLKIYSLYLYSYNMIKHIVLFLFVVSFTMKISIKLFLEYLNKIMLFIVRKLLIKK